MMHLGLFVHGPLGLPSLDALPGLIKLFGMAIFLVEHSHRLGRLHGLVLGLRGSVR